jgi:hypothetical protein
MRPAGVWSRAEERGQIRPYTAGNISNIGWGYTFGYPPAAFFRER